MIGWIPTQFLSTVSELPAQERRRIWWQLYRRTFRDPRAIATSLLLLASALGGILATNLLTGVLFVVSFWLHWAVCGRVAYPEVEGVLRADGLLSDQTEPPA